MNSLHLTGPKSISEVSAMTLASTCISMYFVCITDSHICACVLMTRAYLFKIAYI